MIVEESVFISYAHKDVEKNKVIGFYQFLKDRLPKKIQLLLDRQRLGIGKNIPEYVNLLKTTPVVVILCTPEYKRKVDSAVGGVFDEYRIIERRYNDLEDDVTVLTVLFEGNEINSIPCHIPKRYF